MLKEDVRGEASVHTMYEDNLLNRTGLFANCCTQLCWYLNGHLHATVLMPQAIYILIWNRCYPRGIVNENQQLTLSMSSHSQITFGQFWKPVFEVHKPDRNQRTYNAFLVFLLCLAVGLVFHFVPWKPFHFTIRAKQEQLSHLKPKHMEVHLYCHSTKANLLRNGAVLGKALTQNTPGSQISTFSHSGTNVCLPVVEASFVLLQFPVRAVTDN